MLANQLSNKWTETELNWAIWNSFFRQVFSAVEFASLRITTKPLSHKFTSSLLNLDVLKLHTNTLFHRWRKQWRVFKFNHRWQESKAAIKEAIIPPTLAWEICQCMLILYLLLLHEETYTFEMVWLVVLQLIVALFTLHII